MDCRNPRNCCCPTFYFDWVNSPKSEEDPTVLNGGLKDNLNFGTVEYDTEDISAMFDEFYKYWFIHDPYNDFVHALQTCYDQNKEKIDRYYAHVKDLVTTPNSSEKYTFGARERDYVKGSRSDTNSYGKRKDTEQNYDYPITGVLSSSTPSTGTVNESDAFNDTLTYGQQSDKETQKLYVNEVERKNDTDPIKTVNDVEKLRTFNNMFVDCFKPCFTLFESVTW